MGVNQPRTSPLGTFSQEEFADFRVALEAAGYHYGYDAAINAFTGWKLAQYASNAVVLHVPASTPQAWRDVIAERRRQISSHGEGFSTERDDAYDGGVLAAAASAYALCAADNLDPRSQGDGQFCETPPTVWPWSAEWWKSSTPRRDLVKACALALAEIEKIDRENVKLVASGKHEGAHDAQQAAQGK